MNNANKFDVIMVGGGVMGCATAYYLLDADPTLKVAIVEMEPSYEHNSSVLSDGNIRLQFNIKENILVEDKEKWEDTLEVFMIEEGKDMKVEINLSLNGSSYQYKSLTIWFDVFSPVNE